MRRVHGEATEWVVFIGRQRNAWEPTGRVGTECVVVFIGRAWMEQAMETRPSVPHNGGNGPPTFGTGSYISGRLWRTAKQRKRTSYGRNRVLLIGRGVAYRKTEETDLLHSKWGSC